MNAYAAKRARPIPKAGYGIVVISTHALKPCWAMSTTLLVYSEHARVPGLEAMQLTIDNSLLGSDFPDHTGSLDVLTLPAGNYRVRPRPADPKMYIREDPIWQFTVAAGEALYLGEFDANPSCSMTPGYSIVDQQERDLSLVATLNPAFSSVQFTKRLMTIWEH